MRRRCKDTKRWRQDNQWQSMNAGETCISLTADKHRAGKVGVQPSVLTKNRITSSHRVNSTHSKCSKSLTCSVRHSLWVMHMLLLTWSVQYFIGRCVVPENMRPSTQKSQRTVYFLRKGSMQGGCLLPPQGYITTTTFVISVYITPRAVLTNTTPQPCNSERVFHIGGIPSSVSVL